ncbi:MULTISPECIES: TipC family immunity protein [unclassified Listeria]|uniref:TipC family immunity protein n=1 Tax=unclassified Listeria TaxID=2642072 RepID=UPI000B594BAB|nr:MULTISPECIES: TipC family immunity protein [unclassified Listeria]
MEKRTKIIAIVVLLLMIVVAFVSTKNITQSTKAENIFDEIFYDEREALDMPGNGGAALARVEGMEQWNRAGADNIGEQIFYEKYEKSSLPMRVKDMYYIFSFINEDMVESKQHITKKDKVTIVIMYQFGDNLFTEISYIYDVKAKILTKGIAILDDEQVITKDKEDIEKYFVEKGTSLEEIENLGEDLLRSRLLTDWCSVYDSQFSQDDFGEVEIKKKY